MASITEVVGLNVLFVNGCSDQGLNPVMLKIVHGFHQGYSCSFTGSGS